MAHTSGELEKATSGKIIKDLFNRVTTAIDNFFPLTLENIVNFFPIALANIEIFLPLPWSNMIEVGKMKHRKNHNTHDENYDHVVVRMGWTYAQGNNGHTLPLYPAYGITYDDYPIVLASTGATRPVSEGTPQNINDLLYHHSVQQTVIVKSTSRGQCTLLLYREDPGIDFGSDTYFGVSWIAIGKKT